MSKIKYVETLHGEAKEIDAKKLGERISAKYSKKQNMGVCCYEYFDSSNINIKPYFDIDKYVENDEYDVGGFNNKVLDKLNVIFLSSFDIAFQISQALCFHVKYNFRG